MDLRKLKTILDLFENSAISELELSEGEERLRLTKGAAARETVVHHQPVAPPVQAEQAPSVGAKVDDAATEEAADQADDGLFDLTSPMVGTFYAQPSEDAEPFVKVGDHVTEGDPVCIIEAMKLFNTVNAPVTGTIRKIDARNGEPVGYGDLLMSIEAD